MERDESAVRPRAGAWHFVDRLVESFPAATGRQIRGRLKLVAKYCHQKSTRPTVDVFQSLCHLLWDGFRKPFALFGDIDSRCAVQ